MDCTRLSEKREFLIPDVWVPHTLVAEVQFQPDSHHLFLGKGIFSPALPKHPPQPRVNNAEHDLFTVWKWVILCMIHLPLPLLFLRKAIEEL